MSGYGYKPSDFPPPKENELDFPDPPDYLSSWNRIFWCLNRTVRDKILLNRNGQNSKQMFFCVYNGFCTFHVNDIGKDRIEHHFNKNPSHRILEEDFDDWKRLANRWKELRSRRARERSPPNSYYDNDRRFSSGYHENSPAREHRLRSPPMDYRREGSFHEARFRPKAYHEDERLAPPRTRERSPFPPREHRTWSSRERSPRDHRPSYQGNSYPRDRDRSPRRREGSDNRTNYSPERYERDSRSPARYSRSPSVGRSRSPLSRGGNSWAPSSSSQTGRGGRNYHFSRSYGSTPGAVGRYNSKLAMSPSQIPKPSKRKEWVCLDQGVLKGCEKIFHDQLEYNEHVKIRNLARDKICPERKEREKLKREEQKGSEVNVKNEWKGFKGPTEEITIPDSPPYIAPGEDRGVSPPAGQESFSVRDDGVLLLPEISSSTPPDLPDIITSSKPQESGPPKLRLPVVNRSSSPPAASQPPVRSPVRTQSSETLWNNPSPVNAPDPPATRSPNKEIVRRVRVVRSPETERPAVAFSQQISDSPSSSKAEPTKVFIPTRKTENPKLPIFIRNSEKPKQVKVAEKTDNSKNTNQKENDDLAMLLDKKVVRRQQLGLLSEKKKDKTVEKMIPENVQKKTAASEESPNRVDTSRSQGSFEAALSLSDISAVKSGKTTTEKSKKVENKIERIYINKDKAKTIVTEAKPIKRKAVESSDEREDKIRKTVSVSDRNQDSPRSDVDTQEEVHSGKSRKAETDEKNEDPPDDVNEEDMLTSQDVDPPQPSPTPTEEEDREVFGDDEETIREETDAGVISTEGDDGELSKDIPEISTETANNGELSKEIPENSTETPNNGVRSKNIPEILTETANNDDDLEQIELLVATIVRERKERASADSNTSKKSKEQVNEKSNQPESKEDDGKSPDCPQLESSTDSQAELLRPAEAEAQSTDIEGEEAIVLQRVEKEVEEITEDEEEDPEVRQVLELLEKEESDGEFSAQFEEAGQDCEENEEEGIEESVLYFGML